MDDDLFFDCTDRNPEDGRINIDPTHNGPVDFDESHVEIEHGRPVSNPSVFTFLTNIYHGRKNSAHPIPIPERIVTTLQHVKNALLVDPISYDDNGNMIGMDEYTSSWFSKKPQHISLGREGQKMMPDRKGNRYMRKYYIAGAQKDPSHPGDMITLSHDMEPFEAAQFVNLCPESAEEAKALIPTLDRLSDKELHWYRDELTKFDIYSTRRDSEPAHKRMRHVRFKERTVDTAMRDVYGSLKYVRDQPE